MLPNFEEITVDLNSEEYRAARIIAEFFKAGQPPIKAKDIVVRYFNAPENEYRQTQTRMDEARVRKIVNHICKYYHQNLIGTSKGYYLTNDVKELARAAATLQSRANENTRRSEVILSHLKALAGSGN